MLELICPLCQQPLLSGSRQWVCANGHSYDQARQGYLNLLLVQHKPAPILKMVPVQLHPIYRWGNNFHRLQSLS